MTCWLGCLPALPVCTGAVLIFRELDRKSVHVVGHGTDSPNRSPRLFLTTPPPTLSDAASPTAGLKETSCTWKLLLLNSLNYKEKLPFCQCWVHGLSLKKRITDTSGWLCCSCGCSALWRSCRMAANSVHFKIIFGMYLCRFHHLNQETTLKSQYRGAKTCSSLSIHFAQAGETQETTYTPVQKSWS